MCVVASLIYTYLYMDIYIPIYGYIHISIEDDTLFMPIHTYRKQQKLSGRKVSRFDRMCENVEKPS